MPNDEIQLRVLRLLEQNPQLTQRQLSAELGVSLGKTHYVVKSLIDVGLIKLDNFQRSNNKLGYAYLLTPKGICLLYTSPSPRDRTRSRMPSSA